MNEDRGLLGRAVGVATILGAIFIPIAIFFGQVLQTSSTEKQNRKVGIAQILSDNYSADCQQQIDTTHLIDSWFDIDEADTAGLINYLQDGTKDCSQTQEEIIRNKVKVLQTDIVAVAQLDDALKNYKITIHYLDSDKKLKSEAESLKSSLETASSNQLSVSVKGKSQSWFDSTGGLSDDQIRYERVTEIQAAVALQQLLTKAYPTRQFRLQTIRGTTPNSISIFLKNSPANTEDA